MIVYRTCIHNDQLVTTCVSEKNSRVISHRYQFPVNNSCMVTAIKVLNEFYIQLLDNIIVLFKKITLILKNRRTLLIYQKK